MLQLLKIPPAIKAVDFNPGGGLDIVSSNEVDQGFKYQLNTVKKGPLVSKFIRHTNLLILDGDFKIYKPVAFSIVGKDLVRFIDRTKMGQMPINLSTMLSDFVFLDIPDKAFLNTGLGEDTFMLRLANVGKSCALMGSDDKDLTGSLFSMSKSKEINRVVTADMNIYFAPSKVFGKTNNLNRLDLYPVLGQIFMINRLVTISEDNGSVVVRFNGANDIINKVVFYEKLVELGNQFERWELSESKV